ncbi:hypothetical protein M0811_00725 [Anaeramoeba ignava]|uniref:Uncharacterized protein n=1 Tax=Anaeramoeba ignava TaxID=1746090 RepID=A0A9Q0RBG1_ANAIG|nr:hypothetical protein M0811_00725 [Anaeramoeba ignava]
MSSLKEILKESKKPIQIDSIFGLKFTQKQSNLFFKFCTNSNELSTQWNNRYKPIESNKLNWYFKFSKLFLRSHKNWIPHPQKRAINQKHSKSKITRKFKNLSQFEQAIKSNQIHPPELIYETIRFLKIFCQWIDSEFEPKSEENIEENVEQSKLTISQSSQNCGISLLMATLLASSFYNREQLKDFGIINILIYLINKTITILENIIQEKEKQDLDSISRKIDFVEFILANVLRLFQLFIDPEFYPKKKHILELVEGNDLVQKIIQLNHFLLILSQNFVLTLGEYNLQLKLIEMLRVFNYQNLFNEKQISQVTKMIIENLPPSNFQLPKIQPKEKFENSFDNITKIISDHSNKNQPDQNIQINIEEKMHQEEILVSFHLRMIVLKLIREIIDKNPFIEQEIVENANFNLLGDFILWIGFNIPTKIHSTKFPTKIEMDQEINFSELPEPVPFNFIPFDQNPQLELIDFSQIQKKYNVIEIEFPLPEIGSIVLNTKFEEFFEELIEICKLSLLSYLTKTNNNPNFLENEIVLQNQTQNTIEQHFLDLPKTRLYIKLISICLDIFNTDSDQKPQNQIAKNYLLNQNPGLQLYILKFFQSLFETSIHPIFASKIFWKYLFNKYFLFYFNENFKSVENVPQSFKILRDYLLQFSFFVSNKFNLSHSSQIIHLINIVYHNKSNIDLAYHIFSTICQLFYRQKDPEKFEIFREQIFAKICDLVLYFHQIHMKNWGNSKEKIEKQHQLWSFIKLRYLSFQILSYFICMTPQIFQNKPSNNYMINNSSTATTLLSLIHENQAKHFSFTIIHKLFSFINKDNFYQFELLACAILKRILEIKQTIENGINEIMKIK